jgi:FAD/FMN-containing dehydrogenase
MSTADPILKVTRTEADGTGRAAWTFETVGERFRCTSPDGAVRELRAATLLAALAEVPDAVRLEADVVHTVTCEDPEVPVADLADVFAQATAHLSEITWQEDYARWDDALYAKHVSIEDFELLPDEISGNLPLEINGARCLPVTLPDGSLRVLPFEARPFEVLAPLFLTDLGGVSASNEWGSFEASLGVLPRGYFCAFETYDESTSLVFERVQAKNSEQLRLRAIDYIKGITESFSFTQRPEVELLDGGGLALTWPDGFEPADYGEGVSVHLARPLEDGLTRGSTTDNRLG